MKKDENTILGLNPLDDAGVYRLSDDLAIVQSVDFFTPVVDDPYDFGRIAAANALSDLYAMGARPITALNIVAFPVEGIELRHLGEILRGGAEVVERAGAVLLGGHSIQDAEPKFGMAVTGVIHPDRLTTKGGLEPGQALILTKAVGTGIINTAAKQGVAEEDDLREAIASMIALNDAAAAVVRENDVKGCTDVTGFGLLGHLLEMARASQVSVRVYGGRVPLLPGVERYLRSGAVPGGTRSNLSAVRPHLRAEVSEELLLTLADAQTSGGLLFGVKSELAEDAVKRLIAAGCNRAAVVGEVLKGPEVTIEVVP